MQYQRIDQPPSCPTQVNDCDTYKLLRAKPCKSKLENVTFFVTMRAIRWKGMGA